MCLDFVSLKFTALSTYWPLFVEANQLMLTLALHFLDLFWDAQDWLHFGLLSSTPVQLNRRGAAKGLVSVWETRWQPFSPVVFGSKFA